MNRDIENRNLSNAPTDRVAPPRDDTAADGVNAPVRTWQEEHDITGHNPAPIWSVHFDETEIEATHITLEAQKARYKSQAEAFERCIGKSGIRMTTYLYPYIPSAVEAIQREIKMLEDEITMFEVERERYRHHRAAVRWLFARGKTVEDVAQQAEQLPDPLPQGYFMEVLGYVAIYKRAFRVAAVLLEALASKGSDHEIGAMFSFLVRERLFSSLDIVRTPRHPELEHISTICTELLNRIMTARGPGRPIILSKEAIRALIHSAPIDMLSEVYTSLLMAQGGDYKTAISVPDSLRIISRLARPESGSPKWRAAFMVLKNLDGDPLLLRREARQVMYQVLQGALGGQEKEDPDSVEQIMTFIARNSPANWSADRVLIHHHMSEALAALDGTALRQHFQALLSRGKAPDMVTLCILHTYYKRIGDEGSRREVMTEALKLTRPSAQLATDILHAMVLSRESYENVFREYRQHFMTGLLTHFGLTDNLHGTPPLAEQRKRGLYRPDHITLAVMLQSYLNNTHSVLTIWNIYASYQRFLTGRNANGRYKAIRKRLLNSGTYIPHIIMLALSRYRRGLPHVANILEDLLRPGFPVQADVYTWSIFLRALTLHGKQDEAEAVLEMMKQRNMEPNVVTWTTLLVGYIHGADPEAGERVLERMQEDGVAPNAQTWAAIIRGWVSTPEGKGDWRAGDAFRRMLDAGVEPDDYVHQALEGLRDRDRFEAGLSGEKEFAESVFEDGELSYPEVELPRSTLEQKEDTGKELNLRSRLDLDQDPLFAIPQRTPQTDAAPTAERSLPDTQMDGIAPGAEDADEWAAEAKRQEEQLRQELEMEQARAAEQRRREIESMFEEGELTWAEAKVKEARDGKGVDGGGGGIEK